MVQNFMVFVDGPTTAKIKTVKVFNGSDNDVTTAMWLTCAVHEAPKIAATQEKRANGQNCSRNVSYSCTAFYNSDGKQMQASSSSITALQTSL